MPEVPRSIAERKKRVTVESRWYSTLKNSGGTAVNWHTYTYNAGNQRSQMIAYPANRKVDYTYDDGGQLLKADGKESGGTSRPH